MIDRQKITASINELARQFHPERVDPFVSYAHGTLTTDSATDLLVT